MVFLMLLVPPWLYTVDSRDFHIRQDAGYALIFEPPKPDGAWEKGLVTKEGTPLVVVKIDMTRLLIQVAAAGMCTLLLTFLFHRRKAVAP